MVFPSLARKGKNRLVTNWLVLGLDLVNFNQGFPKNKGFGLGTGILRAMGLVLFGMGKVGDRGRKEALEGKVKGTQKLWCAWSIPCFKFIVKPFSIFFKALPLFSQGLFFSPRGRGSRFH